MDFIGKNIVITGAATGFGRQMTVDFCKGGANNVICLDINMEDMEKLKAEYQDYPIHPYKVDISRTKDVEEVLREVIVKFGQIHVLINNAGIASKMPLEELTEEEWDRVLGIDLKGVYNTCRVILPAMKQYGYGKIINMSSVAGKQGGGLLSTCAYAAAKAGVLGLTKCMAREGGAYGINVNAVCPGSFDTQISKEMSGARLEGYLNSICLKRRGRIEEVSNVVLFLASDLASYITGECTDIDGGQIMD
uniref:SDR family NAD(P)-dependent oxidoreductase n=1 Tax=Enterocloster hominis (ex Hitch et al. 2024) TaxID=1917870 RepID=UPI0010326754|nr:SDR family NAD(P)-dependent oxidoreductase [Lachnoclostridium pacaense]